MWDAAAKWSNHLMFVCFDTEDHCVFNKMAQFSLSSHEREAVAPLQDNEEI